MSFQFTNEHREEYCVQGLTILRGLIPPTLLTDLRRETDTAREIARKKHGPQAQRLQPVYAYEELNHAPFREFLALEGLQATVEGILGKDHRMSEIMGVLLEPAERPWCTHWHRDWGYNAPGIDIEDFFGHIGNLGMFNQLNAALYDDHSLWVVPGSHHRQDNAQERAVFPTVPPPGPPLSDEMTVEEREWVCQNYVRQMPGATPVMLLAGDCAFYRACGWHLGAYVPYGKRATLHDGFYGPEDRDWQAAVARRREEQANAAQTQP